MASIRQTMVERGGTENDLDTLTPSELVSYNPLLKKYTPTTRLAYAKFKSFNLKSSSSNNNKNPFSNVAKSLETKSTIKEESETTTKSSAMKKAVSRSASLVDSISSLHGCLAYDREVTPETVQLQGVKFKRSHFQTYNAHWCEF